MSRILSKRDSYKKDAITSFPLWKEENDKDDTYEDAYEIIPAATTMDLVSSLEECTTGLYLFLNNRFSEAINLIYPWSKNSIYHALVNSILMVVKAILTFDPQDIDVGMTAAKEALKTCNSFRRKGRMTSFSRLVSKQGIKAIKEEELHAEVCYAELLILKSAVTFIQDDSMLGFLEGSCALNPWQQWRSISTINGELARAFSSFEFSF